MFYLPIKKLPKILLPMVACAVICILVVACGWDDGISARPEGLIFEEYRDGYAVTGYVGNSTAVDIPSIHNGRSVIAIADEAFSGNDRIEKIEIGNGVSVIGRCAFLNCRKLKRISFPDSVSSVNASAFCGCSSLEYTVYRNVKYLGSDENPYHALIGPMTAASANYVLHENTKIICDYAFADNKALKLVIIPDGTTAVGYYAFGGCQALEKTIIPESVVRIDDFAFHKNKNGPGKEYLESQIDVYKKEIADNSATVEALVRERDAYRDFLLEKTGSVSDENLISFDEKIKKLSSLCDGLRAEINELPTQLDNADNRTITDITFKGTTEQWGKIEKSGMWNGDTDAYTVRCVNGDLTDPNRNGGNGT